MGEPSVSVVICAYTMERLKDVHEAVDSALAQTLKPHEVIVAIDHNEELFHRLKAELPPEVKTILNDGPYRGSSATDNAGVSLSRGDIVAFMDDDAVAERDWLEHLIKPYQDPSIVAVGGRLIPVWTNRRPEWFCEELYWIVGSTYKGHPEARTEVRNLIFCNASLRRQVFDSIGLFPAETGRLANWGTGFESQAFLRLKFQMPDSIILYEPDAVVHHKVAPYRAKIKYLILRSYNEGFFKAKVKKASAGLSQKPLSTENSYLRNLLLASIPQRLRHFYKPWALAQAGAIIISIVATGLGYLMGKLV
jgi:glycosyltransferase involved in cell wall biosynthesis